MRQTTILVVDDDPSVNRLVQSCIEAEGWDALSAFDGYEALELVRKNRPDLVILDVMMPGINGFDVCRQISCSATVLMLTAKGNVDDKVKCLSAGAEDYITKPFDTRELIARVKVVLRRRHGLADSASFSTGDLSVNFDAKQVRIRNVEVKLTPTEYLLLEALAENAGKALTYKYLLQRVWGEEYSEERQLVHIHIGRLRAKIEPGSKTPIYVITTPGIGYRLSAHPPTNK